MTIDLGQQISSRSESGMQVRLYSDFPFKRRSTRPPPDDFEREALAQLRQNPTRPYYRFDGVRCRAKALQGQSSRYSLSSGMSYRKATCGSVVPKNSN